MSRDGDDTKADVRPSRVDYAGFVTDGPMDAARPDSGAPDVGVVDARAFPYQVFDGGVACPRVPADITQQWIRVPGGVFRAGVDDPFVMPDARPSVEVHIEPFEVLLHEVTVSEYRKCVEDGLCQVPFQPSIGPDATNFDDPCSEDQPIAGVNWQQACRYARIHDARLMSEAEYEYLATNHGATMYPWGNDAPTCDRAVFQDCFWDPETERPLGPPVASVVCSRPGGRSVDGLCDLAGNVSEWVADQLSDDHSQMPRDGTPFGGTPDCDGQEQPHLAKGGGWMDTFLVWPPARRWGYSTAGQGFRLAR